MIICAMGGNQGYQAATLIDTPRLDKRLYNT